jgi:ABC-type multidrug transport system ATPase subunit
LNGVDFLVEEGEVFGLLGHNGMLIKVLNFFVVCANQTLILMNFKGAGKTSTMKIIIAEEASDSGRVLTLKNETWNPEFIFRILERLTNIANISGLVVWS